MNLQKLKEEISEEVIQSIKATEQPPLKPDI
jgi:hypothetical protein